MYRKVSLGKGGCLGRVSFHSEIAVFCVGLTYKHCFISLLVG